MKILFYKKPITQPNKVLEGFNLKKLAQIVQRLFYIIKITFLDYQAKYSLLYKFFVDLTILELCWAV